jgi:hypothetical protein
MKNLFLAAPVALLLMLCMAEAGAQNNLPDTDQPKLMQAWKGTWLQKWNKDTVEVWKIKQYGKSYTMDVYLEVKGKKTHIRKNNYLFSAEDGKFKGFQLYYDGHYDTWTGSFSEEKKFNLEITNNFVPGSTIYKFEMIMETPDSFTLTRYENGVKVKDFSFRKEK